MTSVARQPAIELSQWVGGMMFGRAAVERQAPIDGAARIGALEIYRAEEGAGIALFGTPGDPSVALFDGYLLDRSSLLRTLHLPSDATTAQIAASAYEAWDAGFLEHLTGSYIVVIWDARRRRLLLGHDPLGRHPVFYAASAEAIWFSSNVLALASSGKVSNRPNRVSLALAALTLWPEAGETFFASIRRMRPGHFLDIAIDGSVREVKYWEALTQGEDEWLSEREVLDQFEPTLEAAVSRCMDLSPDGLMLSGGVDSVVIGALASRHRRQRAQSPIVALSGRSDVPEGGPLDVPQEEGMQDRAAAALGMRHIVSRTSEWTHHRDDISTSLAASADLPGPSRVYWVGTYMAFYRLAVAHELRVLLTGSGGDNWLAVADTHAADLIRGLRFGELTRFVRTAARTGGSTFGRALRRLVWHGGIRPIVDTQAAKLLPGPKAAYHRRRAERLMPSWLCPDPSLRREVLDRWVGRRIPALDARGRTPANYYQHSVGSSANSHLVYEFETASHVDAMCGVRLLSPYHDRDLVSLCTRIPPLVLVHGNRYKGLLRPIVEKYLPGLGFGEQRKDYPRAGQEQALNSLRRDVLRAWPTFTFDALAELGLVDQKEVRGESDRANRHGHESLVRMFALMSAERWLVARAR